ncbi:MAG: hypothetical protein L3J26_04940 [Candidatus Polarisedimenticolaceae bacterium]|nr:hypothetical protein [Candidatus Polarisedimenticolaceae bacterium]
MKTPIYLLLLLSPFALFAAEKYEIDKKEMQAMMAQMQKLQDCIQKIDHSEITAAEERARALGEEVKALCANGKRDQAQERAISFSKKLATIPALQELKRCGELSTGMAPMMPLLDQYKVDYFAQYDVCQQ